MPDESDIALVREFASQNSEAAFAELVRRHISLVYSVALRFTGNDGDAQDVTQAVFVILARKAATLRDATVLSGWLYETTRFSSLRLLRAHARRRAHEQEAAMLSNLAPSGPDALWAQISPHLEAVMSRLGQRDRTLLVLRYYENKTGAEAAALLGIREDAARKGTNRALAKLRRFLFQRGVDSTPALIAETISANAMVVVPAALAKTAVAVALANGATASASTATLIKGALKIMAWTKAKTAVISVVILAVAGTSAMAVHQLQQRQKNSGETAMKEFSRTPNGALALEAVHFLGSLKADGQLPGLASNTPAGIAIPWVTFDKPGGTPQFTHTNLGDYPIFITLTVHADLPHQLYQYIVTKMSPTNGWQLQQAWLADTNGAVVKELPVP